MRERIFRSFGMNILPNLVVIFYHDKFNVHVNHERFT